MLVHAGAEVTAGAAPAFALDDLSLGGANGPADVVAASDVVAAPPSSTVNPEMYLLRITYVDLPLVAQSLTLLS